MSAWNRGPNRQVAALLFDPTYRLAFAGFSSAAFNMVSMFMIFTSIRVARSHDMTIEYCRRIKKLYGLTNRESDVLELILRGQFVPQMAEALCVSENTVRSHCKTLYKKLGVHSRQQLFDLVESAQQ